MIRRLVSWLVWLVLVAVVVRLAAPLGWRAALGALIASQLVYAVWWALYMLPAWRAAYRLRVSAVPTVEQTLPVRRDYWGWEVED